MDVARWRTPAALPRVAERDAKWTVHRDQAPHSLRCVVLLTVCCSRGARRIELAVGPSLPRCARRQRLPCRTSERLWPQHSGRCCPTGSRPRPAAHPPLRARRHPSGRPRRPRQPPRPRSGRLCRRSRRWCCFRRRRLSPLAAVLRLVRLRSAPCPGATRTLHSPRVRRRRRRRSGCPSRRSARASRCTGRGHQQRPWRRAASRAARACAAASYGRGAPQGRRQRWSAAARR